MWEGWMVKGKDELQWFFADPKLMGEACLLNSDTLKRNLDDSSMFHIPQKWLGGGKEQATTGQMCFR